jgi:hypothetical protein
VTATIIAEACAARSRTGSGDLERNERWARSVWCTVCIADPDRAPLR